MPRDGSEIGQAAKPVRRQTIAGAIPKKEPSAAKIEAKPPAKPRRRGAKSASIPNLWAPLSEATTEIGGGNASGRDGQISFDTHVSNAAPANITSTVRQIVELQKIRRHCIKSQSQLDRSMESLIASALGFRVDLEEKERKALFRQAGDIRRSVEKGGEGLLDVGTQEPNALSAIIDLIPINAQSRNLWDTRREEVEAKMASLVVALPAWPYVETVRGIGARGFAVLVAEAGIPIGEYRTVSGLWRRLGLAVINGERQRKKTDLEQAALHRYNPTRRAEVWAFCSDVMFRHQWAGDKDEKGKDPKKTGKPIAVPAHAIGLYGEIYARRRAYTAQRIADTADLPAGHRDKWTKGRCHNDARRIMTKELLKHLWIKWRKPID
jgi:hypothetical protein